jgi:phage-related minor tail protein
MRIVVSNSEEGVSRLEDVLRELEVSLADNQVASQNFKAEIDDVRDTLAAAGQEAAGLSRSFGGSLRSAFGSLVIEGDKLSDVLGRIGMSMANTALNNALKPATNALGGAIASGVSSIVGSILPFASGGVVSSGRVQAFASGGVVSGPTYFPMRRGLGLMGEAGPEAIMPLARGADGKLGVRSDASARPVTVTVNISTPDVAGFKRSRSQIAAEMHKALQRSTRSL